MSLQILVPVLLSLWLLGLTIALFLFLRFFKRLVKGVKDFDLKKVLDKVLAQEQANKEGLELIIKEVRKLEEDGRLHVQKVGLVRFNPFKEIGGGHRFFLALLDGKDTGGVRTGLHTRERTRVYMKAVKAGKSEHELSDDERKALVKAQKSI